MGKRVRSGIIKQPDNLKIKRKKGRKAPYNVGVSFFPRQPGQRQGRLWGSDTRYSVSSQE